jgi:hypothetical protein
LIAAGDGIPFGTGVRPGVCNAFTVSTPSRLTAFRGRCSRHLMPLRLGKWKTLSAAGPAAACQPLVHAQNPDFLP